MHQQGPVDSKDCLSGTVHARLHDGTRCAKSFHVAPFLMWLWQQQPFLMINVCPT
jgi:hypothetical protein